MYHAEKIKYAPLRNEILLLENRVESLRTLMEGVCNELGIILTDHSKLSRKESEHYFHLKAISDGTLHLSRTGGKGSVQLQLEKTYVPHLEAGEAAFDVLDAMLRLLQQHGQVEALPKDDPDLDYLKQTFADQEDRYHNLIHLMLKEFILSKEGIARAIAEGDVMSYRQIKHKLQPSTSYLRMPNFTQVMEGVKLHFDNIDKEEMKEIRLKLFYYFDKIIDALQQELQRLEKGHSEHREL